MANPNLLHVLTYVIPTPLDVNIIAFFQEQIDDAFNFCLYQAQTGVDITAWQDNTLGPILGFNKSHLLPYISDPTGKIQGSFIIHDEKIVYQPRFSRLEEMRDKYLWSYANDYYYSQLGALDLVEGFLKEGYRLYQYNPKDIFSAPFVYAPMNVDNLKEKNLSKISLNDLVH